jgi:hypothetical protein
LAIRFKLWNGSGDPDEHRSGDLVFPAVTSRRTSACSSDRGPVREPALADQHVSVPGKLGHRRQQELWDHTPDATLDYIVTAAGRGHDELPRVHPGRLILTLGAELTLFMTGIIAGDTVAERIKDPDLADHLRSEPNRDHFAQGVRHFTTKGRPMIIGEFACCTYQGGCFL